ncbi:MAG: hypothetical protein N3F66_05420 [Spirochaetes bacterium]|nr:hypothetical protein [Spirochaetota bacterium]
MKITDNIVSAYSTKTSTLALKSGQIVVGTITKRIDATTAMVRVGNQFFETRFTKGLPSSNHILLKFDKITGNRFIFSLIEPKAVAHNDILMATPPHYPSFLRRVHKLEALTVFTIHKALFDSMAAQQATFTVLSPLLKRLQQKGIPDKLLQKFCYTLSKETGISLTMHIVQNIGDSSLQNLVLEDEEIQSIMSMLSRDDIESLVQYLGDSSRNLFTVPYYDGTTFNDTYIIADDNFVCIDITFTHLGKLNIVMYEKDMVAVKIYCFNETSFNKLQPQSTLLARMIEEHTGKKALCTCIQKSQWEEKIIALINTLHIQYSIDYSV